MKRSGKLFKRFALQAGAVLAMTCAILAWGQPSQAEDATPVKADQTAGGVRFIGTPPPFADADITAPSEVSAAPTEPVAVGPLPATESVDREKQPYFMVRMLQDLQAQTAKGSTHALRAQRALLDRMNNEFPGLDPVVWKDPRNVRAIALLMLSGGHPAVGNHLLALNLPNSVDTSMIAGALAYIEGHKTDAYRAFAPLNPLTMEPSLGGQVALVQAVLYLPQDLDNALAAVDKARLLMPGSLIEEAALRRGVTIAAAMNNPELFQSYALQYIRHYHNSIYNSDFRRRFGLAMRHFGNSDIENAFDELDVVISEFDLDSQRQFYLLLARAGLVTGKLELARKAAEAALPLAMTDTPDRSRAELYIAGSMVQADRVPRALEHLWAVQRDELDTSDQMLAERVTDILNNIRHWPEIETSYRPDFEAEDADSAPESADWQLDTMKEARKELQEADDLLNYAAKPMIQASR